MTKTVVYFRKSTRAGKKYMVTIGNKTIHFGATGYSDFTKHKDVDRRERYIKRHKSREKWGKSGLKTAGFWSKHVLWNKPTLNGSLRDVASKYNLQIKRTAPPK